MKPGKLSLRSRDKLDGVVPTLAVIVTTACAVMDITVVYGVRSAQTQNKLWLKGRNSDGTIYDRSKVVTFRDGFNRLSKHQIQPGEKYGRAVDIIPHPTGWDSEEHFFVLAGIVFAIAFSLGVAEHITWGRDWDRDSDFDEETFRDFAHFEWTGPVDPISV